MTETCSCSASIRTLSYRRVKAWRREHVHDVPDEAFDPLIHESGSSHERTVDYGDGEYGLARQPIGFALA